QRARRAAARAAERAVASMACRVPSYRPVGLLGSNVSSSARDAFDLRSSVRARSAGCGACSPPGAGPGGRRPCAPRIAGGAAAGLCRTRLREGDVLVGFGTLGAMIGGGRGTVRAGGSSPPAGLGATGAADGDTSDAAEAGTVGAVAIGGETAASITDASAVPT